MNSFSLSRPWMRHAVPLTLAMACGLFVGLSSAPTAVKAVMVAVFFVCTAIWTNLRQLGLHTAINRYNALGQPEPILALARGELAYSKTPRIRVPFSIYRAMALSLQGQWREALDVLDAIDLGTLRGKAQRSWHFLHYSHRFNCLLFLDCADQARTILEDKLVPIGKMLPSRGTAVILDEARAKLAYFEGRPDDARPAFEALAAREEIASASRAVYYYFLGRIELDGGKDPAGHFARALELAGETFIRDQIAALQAR